MKNPVSTLRILALWEGVSFLLLMGIAMPLKYIWSYPMAVTWTGWIHGALFVAFSISLFYTMCIARWPVTRAAGAFIAALLPFGPFVWDKRLRKYEAEFSRERDPRNTPAPAASSLSQN